MKKQLVIAATVSAMLGVTAVSAQSVRISPDEARRNVHVAQSGDTLFGLSGQYLGDPLRWPALWSYNPQITNPHWIYPGDVIYTEAVRESTPLRTARQNGELVHFPLSGFYTASELEIVGELRFASTARRLITTYDTVYIELEDADNVEIGETFALNRVLDRVYDDDDNLVGIKYLYTGELQVTAKHLETDLISAQITDLWQTVERGDVLFVSQPNRVSVTHTPASVDLEAQIIDHLRSSTLLTEHDIVFINRGWEDGVVPGNTFMLWDRFDDHAYAESYTQSRVDYEEDVRAILPWEVIGEAMVIATSEQYSTAIISDFRNRAIMDGTRVTLQTGF